MSQTLEQIALQLSTPQVTRKTVTKETKQIAPKEVEEAKPIPKVQLIYAFNGTGKTRLSRALKNLITPKPEDGEEGEPSRQKILYYNAFTEDLFYWDIVRPRRHATGCFRAPLPTALARKWVHKGRRYGEKRRRWD